MLTEGRQTLLQSEPKRPMDMRRRLAPSEPLTVLMRSALVHTLLIRSLACGTASLCGCGANVVDGTLNADASPPSELDGAALYTEQCAVCHGARGEGGGANPPLANGTAFAQRYLGLRAFPALVRYNEGAMPFGQAGRCEGTRPGTCAFEVSRFLFESFLGTSVDESLVLDEQGQLIESAVEQSCEGPFLGRRQIKLLSRAELRRTLEELLGVVGDVTEALPNDAELDGFDSQLRAAATQGHVQAYFDLALEVATDLRNRSFSGVSGLSADCAEGRATDLAACQAELLSGLGARLFRRELTSDERSDLAELLPLAHGESQTVLELTLAALLNAPGFLYRTELGVRRAELDPEGLPADVAALPPETFVLTGDELAAWLSYGLTGAPPDEVLSQASARGELLFTDNIRAQAARLLDRPSAAVHMGGFASDWLEVGAISSAGKSAELFPEFDRELRADLLTEVETTFLEVLYGGQTVERLFVSPTVQVNARLASFYGLDASLASAGFTAVDAGPHRGGLLQTGAFLAVHAGFEESSPIQRAVSIRRRFMCQDIPPPGDAIVTSGRDDALAAVFADYTQQEIEALTTREFVELQTSPEACAQCHATMINPLGVGLEAFDAVGRHRATQKGKPIDARGALIGVTDILDTSERLEFDGARELSEILAAQLETSRCLAAKALTYVASVEPSAAAECVVAPLSERLHEGAPLRTLFEELGTLETVRFRQ